MFINNNRFEKGINKGLILDNKIGDNPMGKNIFFIIKNGIHS